MRCGARVFVVFVPSLTPPVRPPPSLSLPPAQVMLQRGVDLQTLDASYVSSLAWYGLLMYGLRGVFKLLLGEDSDALNESKAAQMQMGMGMMGGGAGAPAFNAEGAFKHEREQLIMITHKYIVGDAEKRLLGDAYPKAAAAASSLAASSFLPGAGAVGPTKSRKAGSSKGAAGGKAKARRTKAA